MTTPTVSVCIPTYNAAQYLERTLRSALRQTYADFEVIISDDGSTDGTLDLVAEFDDPRIRVLPAQDRTGAAANWNRAVAEANGRFVKLLCQDDVLYPDCLRVQVDAITRGAEQGVVLVSCKRDIVDDDDHVLFRGRGWHGASGVVDGLTTLRSIVRAGANIIGEPSATLFTLDTFQAVGGFSADHTYMIDVDTWIRMLGHGSLSYVPESLCTFRVSRSSWSSQLARRQAHEVRSLLREIRSDHPDEVSQAELTMGLVKTTVLAVIRRSVFLLGSGLPSWVQRSRSTAEIRPA